MKSLEHKIIDIMLRRKTSTPILKEEVEQLEEAKAAGGKYHVSVNYTKGYGGSAEHTMKHYKIDHPGVADSYMGDRTRYELRNNVPQHKEMIKSGWRTADLGVHGSSNEKYAKDAAKDRHDANMNITSMMKKRYGDDGGGSMYESVEFDSEREQEEFVGRPKDKSPSKDKKKDILGKQQSIQKKIIDEDNKDQKRLDTVKKVKAGSKNNKIEIDPELKKSNNAITSTSVGC